MTDHLTPETMSGTERGEAVENGSLRAAIEKHLRGVGFTTYEHPQLGTLWGHPELGAGRYFNDALRWWLGHEDRGAGASTREGEDADSEGREGAVLMPRSPEDPAVGGAIPAPHCPESPHAVRGERP